MSMLRFDHVSKRYPGGNDALSGLTFELTKGEMAFLTGHSGAGKSTLLKLIALIERATRGAVLVGNKNLARISKRQIPYYRRQVGLIFQDHKLLNDRSVADNVALPLTIQGMSQADRNRRVRAALDQVGLLHKEKQPPEALSGGEQQRVGIARAIVNRPPILLADEPTGNLDPSLSEEIMRVFGKLNQSGITVLVATHDLGLIESMDKRIIRLENGHLGEDTDMTDFFPDA